MIWNQRWLETCFTYIICPYYTPESILVLYFVYFENVSFSMALSEKIHTIWYTICISKYKDFWFRNVSEGGKSSWSMEEKKDDSLDSKLPPPLYLSQKIHIIWYTILICISRESLIELSSCMNCISDSKGILRTSMDLPCKIHTIWCIALLSIFKIKKNKDLASIRNPFWLWRTFLMPIWRSGTPSGFNVMSVILPLIRKIIGVDSWIQIWDISDKWCHIHTNWCSSNLN